MTSDVKAMMKPLRKIIVKFQIEDTVSGLKVQEFNSQKFKKKIKNFLVEFSEA